jgi:hypothetical protein
VCAEIKEAARALQYIVGSHERRAFPFFRENNALFLTVIKRGGQSRAKLCASIAHFSLVSLRNSRESDLLTLVSALFFSTEKTENREYWGI